MIVGRRIGVIDIGSNSVRLLIADVNSEGITELYKDLNTTRLYEDISGDYMLSDDSMERTAAAINEYVNIADKRNCDELYMFATAAVRVAKNKNDFISRVKEKTRIILEVLSKEKEAELAFAGVGAEGISCVIDIGGASTELAIGENGKILKSSSAKIGAVKCRENFDDDANEKEITDFIESILLTESKETIKYIIAEDNIRFYGVGGTITTMAAMQEEIEFYDSKIINEISISYYDLSKMINKLQNMDIENRKQLKGLQPQRADIIVFGLLILQTIMKNCNIAYVKASDNDNLTGYIKMITKEV